MILSESKVSAYFLNYCSSKNMRLLLTHSVHKITYGIKVFQEESDGNTGAATRGPLPPLHTTSSWVFYAKGKDLG